MRGFHTRSLSISSFRKCEFLLHNWSQQICAIKSLCCGFCKIHNKIRRYKKSFKNLKNLALLWQGFTGPPSVFVYGPLEVQRLAGVPGMSQHRCGRRWGENNCCFLVLFCFCYIKCCWNPPQKMLTKICTICCLPVSLPSPLPIAGTLVVSPWTGQKFVYIRARTIF